MIRTVGGSQYGQSRTLSGTVQDFPHGQTRTVSGSPEQSRSVGGTDTDCPVLTKASTPLTVTSALRYLVGMVLMLSGSGLVDVAEHVRYFWCKIFLSIDLTSVKHFVIVYLSGLTPT